MPLNSSEFPKIGKFGIIFDGIPLAIDDLVVSSRQLSNPSHMMNMTDPIAISVETLRIDSGCALEKEFTELICINP